MRKTTVTITATVIAVIGLIVGQIIGVQPTWASAGEADPSISPAGGFGPPLSKVFRSEPGLNPVRVGVSKLTPGCKTEYPAYALADDKGVKKPHLHVDCETVHFTDQGINFQVQVIGNVPNYYQKLQFLPIEVVCRWTSYGTQGVPFYSTRELAIFVDNATIVGDYPVSIRDCGVRKNAPQGAQGQVIGITSTGSVYPVYSNIINAFRPEVEFSAHGVQEVEASRPNVKPQNVREEATFQPTDLGWVAKVRMPGDPPSIKSTIAYMGSWWRGENNRIANCEQGQCFAYHMVGLQPCHAPDSGWWASISAEVQAAFHDRCVNGALASETIFGERGCGRDEGPNRMALLPQDCEQGKHDYPEPNPETPGGGFDPNQADRDAKRDSILERIASGISGLAGGIADGFRNLGQKIADGFAGIGRAISDLFTPREGFGDHLAREMNGLGAALTSKVGGFAPTGGLGVVEALAGLPPCGSFTFGPHPPYLRQGIKYLDTCSEPLVSWMQVSYKASGVTMQVLSYLIASRIVMAALGWVTFSQNVSNAAQDGKINAQGRRTK